MFGIHPVYFAVLMMVLGLPALAVLGVVLLASSNRSGRHPAPLISPDGRWWWDGTEWKPVPQQPSPTEPPPA